MKRNDKIYIVGAGAIGKALAVFLQHENKDVILVRGSVDNVPDDKVGITVTNQDNQIFQQEVSTTTFSNLTAINGIVLITAKAFANAELAKKLKAKPGSFSIVLLQNGLNIEKPFAAFENVFRCVLFSGGQVINNNEVAFKMVAPSPVGNLHGKNSGAIINQINNPHFRFRSEPNISKYIWEKVIINCAFNSICPLLEADNGIFHRSAEAAKLARIIIEECVALAGKYKIELDPAEIEKDLMLISKYSEGQLVSTYQDIINKRETEIESLNLEISRLADEIEMPELVPTTQLLGKMIQLKSVEKNKTKQDL